MPVRLLLGSGLLLVGGGLLAMTAVDAELAAGPTLIPGFVLAGAGVGLVNPPLASTAIGVVHYSRSGMASGINNTFRQVGIATGIAGLGAVFQHERHQQHHRGAAPPAARRARCSAPPTASSATRSCPAKSRSSPTPSRRPRAPRSTTPTASASPKRSRRSLMIAAAIALVGAVLAFVLVRSRDFVTSGAEAPKAPLRAACPPAAAAVCSSAQALSDVRAGARSPGRRAPAAADSADRPDRCASAGTARRSSHACCAPAAGARTCRTARPAAPRAPDAVGSAARTSSAA